MSESERVPLDRLNLCFEGAIPAVVATASADGTPNVTYLSRVRMVDADHIALSNQFFSKTARNLAENPRASMLIIDPTTYDEYRLELVYERTDRRGELFRLLSDDVDAVAAVLAQRTAAPLLEILAGVPTVVYGYFAALTVAPAVRDLAVAAGYSAASS